METRVSGPTKGLMHHSMASANVQMCSRSCASSLGLGKKRSVCCTHAFVFSVFGQCPLFPLNYSMRSDADASPSTILHPLFSIRSLGLIRLGDGWRSKRKRQLTTGNVFFAMFAMCLRGVAFWRNFLGNSCRSSSLAS